MSQEVRFVIAVECGTEISSQVMSKAKRSVGTRSLRIDRDTLLIEHNGTVKVPKQDYLFFTYFIFLWQCARFRRIVS
jgi:hypothetical protein